ncbi:MAG: thioredoxin domain-containing protein [Sphingomonadaceae bacterium]
MRIVIALLALLTLGAAPPNWSRTVTMAANGAYVLGNPKAKVRVVEYLSYSCSHCATFTAEATPALKANYIARGTVALELRNAVRDRFDFTASLIARCGGAARFFGNSDAIFAAQDALMAKSSTYDADNTQPENIPVNTALKAVARGSGLTALMARRGFTPAQLDACLIDKRNQDAVLAMTREAWETRKIPGTPTILVNGEPTVAGTWVLVEPQIRAQLAAR